LAKKKKNYCSIKNLSAKQWRAICKPENDIFATPQGNDNRGGEKTAKNFARAGESAKVISTLRIVAKREDKEPYAVNIPVKGDTFSLVIPNGYISWPEGKPYPDSIRVTIDEDRSLWVNFGVSKEYGFYTSLRVGKNNE
jgi:hypothetical protein